jgi:DNA (cytosine-5)-methyltransferase 1
MKYNIVSLFSGAGGLDLGFHSSGFHIAWANEFDKTITPTLRKNFPQTIIDDRSIRDITSSEIPETVGVIGGPPCQSWSEAGAGRGLDDKRGQVFFEHIRVIRDKQPLFFLAENVSGMLSSRHAKALSYLIEEFKKLGYSFDFQLLNVKNYGVPQDRKRVIFVGYHKKLGKRFVFPKSSGPPMTLKNAIWDLKDTAVVAKKFNKTNGSSLIISNHEYMNGGFSTMYMSRNRVRSWDEPSFTIQAGGRHAPIHPQAPKMQFVEYDKRIFVPGKEHLYRRLSVRECARIQTFPDSFEFLYADVADGYKMIGNAVPVRFAQALATQIKHDLDMYYQSQEHLAQQAL